MDKTTTTCIQTSEATKYQSDIVYVSDLVRDYEHTIIKKDEMITELEIQNKQLIAKLQYARDVMYDVMYELQSGVKKKTKAEIIDSMDKWYMDLCKGRNDLEWQQ